jgi:hypothetical protein
VDMLGDGDVAAGIERRKKIETLENEADLVPAEFGALGIAHQGKVVAVNEHFSARGARQAAEDVEQGRFAAARRAHYGHRFTGQHLEIHPTQSGHFEFARVMNFPEILGDEYRFHALNP